MRPLPFVTLLLISTLFACKKYENPANPSPAVYAQLRQIGFTDADITDLGDYYLADGDLLFKKEGTDTAAMRRYFQKGATGRKPHTEQYVAPDIVSQDNVEAIKLYTSSYDIAKANSAKMADWIRMANNAAALWAGIPNTRINFTDQYYYQNTSNSIRIVDDGGLLPNSVIAAAEFPSGGNVGFQIRINPDFLYNYTVSAGMMQYNLVHEIGHTLGFWHSNWATNDGPNSNVHILVPGTPASDPNSVMNGGTALNSWKDFSTYDKMAAQTVFPQGAYYNWLTSPGGTSKFTSYSYYYVPDKGTSLPITWNTSLVGTSSVTLQVYFNGAFVSTIASNIPNTGSYSYPLGQVAAHEMEGGYFISGLRVKIISDNNPAVYDFSPVFYVSNNEQ